MCEWDSYEFVNIFDTFNIIESYEWNEFSFNMAGFSFLHRNTCRKWN